MKEITLLYLILCVSISTVLAQNNKPVLSGPFSYTITAEHYTCISINTFDADTGDSTFIFWKKTIPFASWGDNNGMVKRASAEFCWLPTDNDASTLPYSLDIYATDKKDTVYTRYSITVWPHIKGNRSFINKGNGYWDFTITPVSTFFVGCTYSWYNPKLLGTGFPSTIISDKSTINYKFSDSGRYILRSVIRFDGHVNS